jgi:hypothetical protein
MNKSSDQLQKASNSLHSAQQRAEVLNNLVGACFYPNSEHEYADQAIIAMVFADLLEDLMTAVVALEGTPDGSAPF